MTYPSQLLQVGIAPETTYGTAVAPTIGMAVGDFTPVDKPVLVPDTTWRSNVVLTTEQAAGALVAARQSAISVGGPVFADTIGFALAGLLGDVQVSSGPPYLWTFHPLNSGTQQPHSYTLVGRHPSGQVAYPGCVWASLDISANSPEAALEWTGTLAGLAGAASSYSAPTFSTEKMFVGWQGSVQIGSTAITTCLSFALKIARTITPKFNTDLALDPWLQRAEGLEVTGTASVVCTSDVYRAAMLAGTSQTVVFEVQFGSGTGQRTLTFRSTTCDLSEASRVFGSDWVELDLSWVANANATDVGPSGGLGNLACFLTNGLSAGY